MPINWFPGHMNKAHREIKKAISRVNLIIEVLDARIPCSSENPLIAKLRGSKPAIMVLNKSDLADPKVTKLWLDHYGNIPGTRAVSVHKGQTGRIKGLLNMGRGMLPKDRSREKAIHVMIVGIPNVGKSTLINVLANRKIAKTGNVPAVTRMQQRIRLGRDMVLVDTPGFLWHKLSPKECGYRLAVTGAIKDAVIEYKDIAAFAAKHLLDRYPRALQKRYGLESLAETPEDLLQSIAARRGCIGRGGEVNFQKVSELLIRELRDGTLGPISMEMPSDFEATSDDP